MVTSRLNVVVVKATQCPQPYLLAQAIEEQKITCIKVSKHNIESLILCMWMIMLFTVSLMWRKLQWSEIVSKSIVISLGHEVNVHKSSIHFSRNV